MNGVTYIDVSLENQAGQESETLVTMSFQTHYVEYVRLRSFIGASDSYVLGGRKSLDKVRFVVYNDMIPEPLNATIDLTMFLNIQDASEQVEEAIRGTLLMLLDGMNRRIKQELLMTKAQQEPNTIVRNELRRLVDVYGIDAFAKALKQFERERI